MINVVKWWLNHHVDMKMENLPVLLTLVFLQFFVNHPSSARTLSNTAPSHHHHHNHKITFLMQNVLTIAHTSSKPAATKVPGQIPFSKPLGLFPPSDGIPLPQSNPRIPATGSSSQTFDVSNIGLAFPARLSLQELELGSLTEIDEGLFSKTSFGLLSVGRAQGIFVASSEDGTSHMMAITASFATSEFKEGLRFFGVHNTHMPESHVTVIGGTGKYVGANGYAVIKAVAESSIAAEEENKTNDSLLLFNVYLS